MDFKLMYSSYSKVPARCQSTAAAAAAAAASLRSPIRTIKFWMLTVERQLGHQVVDVL
jgi:hypothetical protein